MVLVDVVSHLVLQVHLGPTREKLLHDISMSLVTGHHEGSITILRNTMRDDVTHIETR